MSTNLPVEFPGGRLRRLRPGDLAAFQAYRGSPALGRFQGWSPMSDADAADFLARMHDKPLLARGQWLQLGIADAASDELIGDIGIYLADDQHRGEIGFTLAEAAQGRGLATAAVDAALRLIFAHTPLREIIAVSDERNAASVRLIERLGFALRETREGEMRGESCTERVYVFERATPVPGEPADSHAAVHEPRRVGFDKLTPNG